MKNGRAAVVPAWWELRRADASGRGAAPSPTLLSITTLAGLAFVTSHNSASGRSLLLGSVVPHAPTRERDLTLAASSSLVINQNSLQRTPFRGTTKNHPPKQPNKPRRTTTDNTQRAFH